MSVTMVASPVGFILELSHLSSHVKTAQEPNEALHWGRGIMFRVTK